MKKTLTLLAATMLTAPSAGCNCCPCLRNLCPFNWSSPAPVATYAPAPVCAPACTPAPVYAAAPATPVFAAPQQYTVPQYAMPAQPVYSEAGCGSSAPCATCTPCESSCGMSYSVADPGCGYTDVGYGSTSSPVVVDPAPAP